MMLALIITGSADMVAQSNGVENIDWSKYARKVTEIANSNFDKKVLLYNQTKGLFLSASGRYGVRATLAENGMHLTIRTGVDNDSKYLKGNYCTIETDIDNEAQGRSLGCADNQNYVYIDRKADRVYIAGDNVKEG